MIKKNFGETSETAKQFRFETAKQRNSHSENEGETTKQRNSCSQNKAETAKHRNSCFDQNFALWGELDQTSIQLSAHILFTLFFYFLDMSHRNAG